VLACLCDIQRELLIKVQLAKAALVGHPTVFKAVDAIVAELSISVHERVILQVVEQIIERPDAAGTPHTASVTNRQKHLIATDGCLQLYGIVA